jgi:hypothetical protein
MAAGAGLNPRSPDYGELGASGARDATHAASVKLGMASGGFGRRNHLAACLLAFAATFEISREDLSDRIRSAGQMPQIVEERGIP